MKWTPLTGVDNYSDAPMKRPRPIFFSRSWTKTRQEIEAEKLFKRLIWEQKNRKENEK